jgi:glycosyltransferase involved in cell wall biosynthesis
MDKNLVSVVIPTYNTSNFLIKAIQSVINQTYKNWELIIVDDGSTDQTRQIVEEFQKKDSRIKYFFQNNKGQGAARNLGIKNASGNYIAFLDSDDEFFENKLERVISHFEKDKNIGFIYTDAIIIGDYLYKKRRSEIVTPYSGGIYIKLLFNNFITTSTVIVKREVLQNCGLFDESDLLRNFEDYDLWLRIAKKYKIEYIPEVLTKYYFVPKITSWKKRRRAYKAMIYIYYKNLKIANAYEKFIVMYKLGEYLLKLIISFVMSLFEDENNNNFAIKK